MENLIQLHAIWDFLCACQNNRLRLKANEPVVFDHFMKFKEKHVEQVSELYHIFSATMKTKANLPQYTPVSPAVRQMYKEKEYNAR